MMKMGILLAGCGFYDGTEIGEAVLSALSLERAGLKVAYLSPDAPQMHTVDHTTGSEVEHEARNLLMESARVARGRIRSLSELHPGEVDGLIIPGGHGAVKNLMTGFATPGEPRRLVPAVAALLSDLAARGAPIGAISLGRAVVQTFLDEPLSESDMRLPATEVEADEARGLYFTPGFLTGTSLPEVATGIDRMVQAMLRLPSRRLRVVS